MARIEKEHLEKVICHAKSLQENGGNMMTFTAYDKSELEAFQREAKERWGTTEAYQAFEKIHRLIFRSLRKKWQR